MTSRNATRSIRQSLTAEEAATRIRHLCEALPSLDDPIAFGVQFERFADARVVLLGEASHGSAEFYRARAAISRYLIEYHGFNIVAVEADWPDANRIDRYVRHRPALISEEEAFARFPTWMWRNQEVSDFVDWLRTYNERLPFEQRTQFRGLDVYSLRSSMGQVIDYLEQVDPEAAVQARKRYECLTPWQSDPAYYGHAVMMGDRDPCEDAVIAQLEELIGKRLEYGGDDGEDYFDAAQNARIVQAAEQYYRLMYRGSTESWNLRDRHMFDTLQQLIKAKGRDAKVIVWAHNSHIGNASATEMGWQGQFNIGELAKTAFGEEAVLIGFGTDRGTVAAADNWDEPVKIKNVVPSRADSYEQVFLQTGIPCALTDLRGSARQELREVLAEPRLERAIGVIYRPDTEYYSHYFKAVLPEQFDAFVWFEETRAVTPLDREPPAGMPETYPFGV